MCMTFGLIKVSHLFPNNDSLPKYNRAEKVINNLIIFFVGVTFREGRTFKLKIIPYKQNIAERRTNYKSK